MAARPLAHLPIFAAAGAALYAGSLSAVTALQADHDAALSQARQPMAEAAQQAAAQRQRAFDAVSAAADALAGASDGYEATVEASQALDGALAMLAEQVALATGAASRLPASVQLPATRSQVVVVAPPATQGTTGASGR